MTKSMFADVAAFHQKFGLSNAYELRPPVPLAPDVLAFRINFMLEELAEFCDSQGAAEVAARLRQVMEFVNKFSDWRLKDGVPAAGLADGGDALIDLVYVALGTAHLMRLPFDEMWDEVQRANMDKERATGADDARSKRGHELDVVKPVGWRAPQHWPIIFERTAGLHARMTAPSEVRATEQKPDLCYCVNDREGHERAAAAGCLHYTKHQ